MTRKDYELIALAIAQACRERKTGAEQKGIESVTEHLCHALQIDNPNFKPGKFVAFIKKHIQ